jgi:hypothetical protein
MKKTNREILNLLKIAQIDLERNYYVDSGFGFSVVLFMTIGSNLIKMVSFIYNFAVSYTGTLFKNIL